MRNKAFDNIIIKALCIALAVIMILGLAACDSQNGAGKTASTASGNPANTAEGQNKAGSNAPGTNGQANGSKSVNEPANSANDGSDAAANAQTGIDSILEFNDGPTVTLTVGGETYELKKDIKTYLFIGIDSQDKNDAPIGETWASSQSDVLILCVIDDAAKEYSVLNINRETIATVDILDATGDIIGQQDQHINFAFAYTTNRTINSENTVRAVSRFLGSIPIDGYVTLAMGALPVLNDTVGGVTITIPEDLTYTDPAFTKGAEVKLTGAQAERFIRVRMGLENDSNQQRMRRQQIYLAALKKTAK